MPITKQQFAEIQAQLAMDGWTYHTIGRYRTTNGALKAAPYVLFIRERTYAQWNADRQQNNNKDSFDPAPRSLFSERAGVCDIKRLNDAENNAGSKLPMGPIAAPASGDDPGTFSVLSAGFADFDSLSVLGSHGASLVIALDSEWVEMPAAEGVRRKMLSWQFATIYEDTLREYFVLPTGGKPLSLALILARILSDSGFESISTRKLTTYVYCDSLDECGRPVVSKTADLDYLRGLKDKGVLYPFIKRTGRFGIRPVCEIDPEERRAKLADRAWAYWYVANDWGDIPQIPVTLLSHFGVVDLSGLANEYIDGRLLMEHCQEVNKGAVTMYDAAFEVRDYIHNPRDRAFPVRVQVRDSMTLAPPGMRSLAALGDTVGVPKVKLPPGSIEHMDQLLFDNPRLYASYASNDSVVALLYTAALCGVNHRLPVTLPADAARSCRDAQISALGCIPQPGEKFSDVYMACGQGIRRVEKGLEKRCDDAGQDRFMYDSSVEPVSDAARMVQELARLAFAGGFNAAPEIGLFDDRTTYDYDLQSAYATVMAGIDDVNWSDPIAAEIKNRPLTLDDFPEGPATPLIAHVRFRFPEGTKYPALLVNVDGVPVYPLASDGMDGTAACGPELFLALKMGAEIDCVRGYRLRMRGTYSLRAAMKQMVSDRAKAREKYGKKSLPELALKVFANSIYGKLAQNVVDKRGYVPYWRDSQDLSTSPITNPVSAAFITSTVRAVLIAAMTQVDAAGYITPSVTTDGFISDIPESELKKMDLFGLREMLADARLFLTDGESAEIWEVKHAQTDLFVGTTRLNGSLESGGVCARGSYKSGFVKGSYEDRHDLYRLFVSRTGPVACTTTRINNLRDTIVEGYNSREVTTLLHFDYDMKRKPIRSSVRDQSVTLDGTAYTVAHVETMPFETVAEFQMWRQKQKNFLKSGTRALRTAVDWDTFFTKVTAPKGSHVASGDEARLHSVIKSHRMGRITIPALSAESGLTVAQKVEWVNYCISVLGLDSRKFTENHWKNARRASRQASVLPEDEWSELAEMLKQVPYDQFKPVDDDETLIGEPVIVPEDDASSNAPEVSEDAAGGAPGDIPATKSGVSGGPNRVRLASKHGTRTTHSRPKQTAPGAETGSGSAAPPGAKIKV